LCRRREKKEKVMERRGKLFRMQTITKKMMKKKKGTRERKAMNSIR